MSDLPRFPAVFRSRFGRSSPLALLVAVASCAGESACSPTDTACLTGDAMTSVVSPQLAPTLSVDIQEVTWSIQQGQGTPLRSVIQVWNGGTGSLAGLSAAVEYDGSGAPWLTASLNATTAPTDLILVATPGNLSAGTHVAEVKLAATGAANSPLEVRVAIRVRPSPTPAAPTGLTAVPSSAVDVHLQWSDKSSDETDFRIERSSDGQPFVEVATVGSDVVTLDDKAHNSANTTYTYRVRACNAAGCSAYSSDAYVTVVGPPILEFRPRSFDFTVLMGDRPPPADLWVVNTGYSTPDVFFHSLTDGDVPVTVTRAEGSLAPGDSLRFILQVSPLSHPVLFGTALIFDMDAGSLRKRPGVGVKATALERPIVPIAAGTVNGSEGTFFAWWGLEVLQPIPGGDFGGCCISPTIAGPPSWNGGAPLLLQPENPKGIGQALAFAVVSGSAPVDGFYAASHSRYPGDATFSVDASQGIAPPEIVETRLHDLGVHVRWKNPPGHRATMVRISSPSQYLLYEEFVPAGATSLSVPWSARLGHPYYFEVMSFNVDMTDALVFTSGQPPAQVDVGIARQTAIIP